MTEDRDNSSANDGRLPYEISVEEHVDDIMRELGIEKVGIDSSPDEANLRAKPELSDSASPGPSEGAPPSTKRPDRVRGDRTASNLIDIKVGPPGSRSSKRALARIDEALRTACGHPRYESKEGEPLLALMRRLDALMTRQRLPDGRTIPYKDSGLGEAHKMSGSRHGLYTVAVIPTQWYGHMTRLRGRGEARSRRTYYEAAHLLAYIVHMYRRQGRFEGRLLWLNQAAVRKLLRISESDYLKAVRYLEREGFIIRVVIRGQVPWDPRSKGVYTFAIPRLPKLGPVTRKGKQG